MNKYMIKIQNEISSEIERYTNSQDETDSTYNEHKGYLRGLRKALELSKDYEVEIKAKIFNHLRQKVVTLSGNIPVVHSDYLYEIENI